jgi:hypothetical protein
MFMYSCEIKFWYDTILGINRYKLSTDSYVMQTERRCPVLEIWNFKFRFHCRTFEQALEQVSFFCINFQLNYVARIQLYIYPNMTTLHIFCCVL